MPQAPRGEAPRVLGFGEGVTSPTGMASGDGTVPPPQKKFVIILARNGAFFSVYFDKNSQFTRPKAGFKKLHLRDR